MSIQNPMVRHTLLLSMVSFLMRGISMTFQIWLSNRIGAEGIGQLQLILTVGGFGMTAGTAGVRVASMYLTAEERGKKRPAGMRHAIHCCLIYTSIVSLIVSAILFSGAEQICSRWISAAQLAPVLRLFAVFLPAGCLTAVLSGWFTACVKIRLLSAIEVCMQLFVLSVSVFLLKLAGTDIVRCCRSIILANGIGDALSLSILYLIYRASQKQRQDNPPRNMWSRLFRLCLPLAGSDLLRSGLSTSEHLLIPRGLSAYGGGTQSAMAAYGTIHGMVFPVMMFPSTFLYALADLLVPELARCRAAGSETRVRYLVNRCLKSGFLFALCISGLLYCLSDSLGLLLYHSTEAARFLRLFAPLVLMLYMDCITDAMLKGLGQQVASVRYNIITSALDIVCLILLLPRFGISGYFWSFTVTHALNFYLSIARLFKSSGYTPKLRFFAKSFLCAAAALAVCILTLQRGASIVAILTGGTVYLGTVCALFLLSGLLGSREYLWIRQLVRGQRTSV